MLKHNIIKAELIEIYKILSEHPIRLLLLPLLGLELFYKLTTLQLYRHNLMEVIWNKIFCNFLFLQTWWKYGISFT